VRGGARRLGLHRIWIPGIRPYRLVQHGRENISCHACGESNYKPFIRDPDHQVVRCNACGLYYVNPVPTPTALRQLVQDSAAYTKDQLVKRAFFTRRAERLFDRVGSVLPPGRLLDIGCAIGTELMVAKARGWTATGIELSNTSVQLAREAGFDVRSQEFVESGFPDHHFNLITMNHVLEHVAHTAPFMSEVRRVLAGNGLLFISLPNVHAWKFYVRRGSYSWTFHHDHYIHFSVSTLSRFLQRFGFHTIETTTPRWLDFHDPIESRSALFQRINASVERLNLGIEIFCLARKAPSL
jgi:2-polyprenyl-3-methyl-5-hydroxy-6-metoxy-1,4-benzoquinol methylase